MELLKKKEEPIEQERSQFNLVGIPKADVSAPDEQPSFKLEGIPKASQEYNLAGIPNEDGHISLIPQIGEGHGKPMRKATPEEDQIDFDYAVTKFADCLAEASTGKTPDALLKGQKELSGVMTRFPQVGIAVSAPYLALGFEALTQLKNFVVTSQKQEKYSPLEARMISELLPSELPTPVKFAANIGEALTDVALIGGAANLAKQGLLDDTIKTIGQKLEAAGYGTGKVTLNRDTLKEYAKGTSLEAEASNWLKAQALQVPTKDKIAQGASTFEKTVMPSDPIGLPPWGAAFGEDVPTATKNLQNIIANSTNEADLITNIKTGAVRDQLAGRNAAMQLGIPTGERIISDLRESGFSLPGKPAFDHKTYQEEQRLNNEPAPEKLITELGTHFGNERGSVTLPDMPIKENIEGFKVRLGQEFIRFYGITPEGRQAFTKLRESQEVREMDVVDFLKSNIALSNQDAKLMTYHLENPNKYPLPDNLRNQASIIDNTFQEVFKELEKRDMIKDKFPQSFINKAHADIANEHEIIKTLKDKDAIARHQEKIKEYEDRIEVLKSLHYVPHQYKPILESQVVNLFREGRISGKLSSAVSKIKGRKIATLDEAKELGLIPEEDIRHLLGSYMEYALRKIAIHDFIEGIKKNKNIIMTEKEAPEDWTKVMLSQLDGYRVHPLMVRALEDYAINPRHDESLLLNVYDKINRVAKTILFYNPAIMTINNLQQTFLAGGINTNLPKYLWESVHDMTNKTDFYKDAIQAGLFSSPYNTRPAIGDQIKLWIDTSNEQYPKLKRTLETLVNPVKMYEEIGKVTWNMDRVLRMSTVKYYLAKGMKFQDAVDRTNLFYVDYAFIPDHLRIMLNRVFLTPTYRGGVARLYTNLIAHPIKNKDAIARLVGFWIATGLFAAWAGYKLENGYRLVKKLKEPIVTPEGKLLEEKVFALPSPLFEYQKIFGRAFSRNLYLNLARVPYIGASLSENKDWKGEQITDRALPLDDRARQIIHYILKTYVAPIEGFESLTSGEQNAIEKSLNLLSVAVYKRQGATKYLINQVERTISDHKDYLRRHPKATDNQRREVQLETQKRIDLILKKIGEHERAN